MDLWLGYDPRYLQQPNHLILLHSDQTCSLTYSLANLYFVGCFYTHSVVNYTTVQSVNGTNPSYMLHCYQHHYLISNRIIHSK